MSLHAITTPEARAALAAQKRNSLISSVIIALLMLVLLGVVLFFIALASNFKNTEEVISYESASDSQEEVSKPEMTNEVESKPSSPSSSMAKVIASKSPSPVAVPVPDVIVTEPSIDFGDGNDFGDGWGSGGGSGAGSGGGGASFFKQKIKAERICYVIDYSASMSGRKIKMLKKELTESISKLPDGIEYQLIFFAGPGWVAGDTVSMDSHKKAEVDSSEKTYKWENNGGNNWGRTGKKQKVEWLKADAQTRSESIAAILETELVWGTTWNDPLEMALAMKPSPDYIFFMTDGAPGTGLDGAMKTAKRIGAKAKSKKIKINTISLLLPAAKEALELMATKSGGQFTLIEK